MTDLKDAIKTLKRNQYLLYVMIFTLVVVLLWMLMALFTSQRRPGISADLQQLATPLNPNLDSEVLERLEAKTHFTSAQLANFPIYKLITSSDGRTSGVVTIDQDSRVFDLRLPDEDLLIDPIEEFEIIEPTETATSESNQIQSTDTVVAPDGPSPAVTLDDTPEFSDRADTQSETAP